MFVLNEIQMLPDDQQSLAAGQQHLMTFKLLFTIKEVPDSFTGVVFRDAEGELGLAHFNHPKGNRRKIITLKNKLAAGVFDDIKQRLFARAQGETVELPRSYAIVERVRRKPGT
jgi:hypothetical protein